VVGLIENPIAPLQGGDLLAARMAVNTRGFSTGYYYGSAGLAWLDVGTRTLTGDVAADELGSLASPTIDWPLWDSADSGAPATESVDVTA